MASRDKAVFEHSKFNLWQYLVMSAASERIQYFIMSLFGQQWM